MLYDQRLTTTLLSLADSWDNHSLAKRTEADEMSDKTLANNLYGYSDGLTLAAQELRTIAEHLSKRNRVER
jgi:hypothetical protein